MADTINASFGPATVLARLEEFARQIEGMRPAYAAIGELLTESTKQRFTASAGPDGQRWAPNAPATILARLTEVSGAYTKAGRLSKKGAATVMGKRPLVDTGVLQDTIRWQADNNRVEVGTNRFAGEWDGGAAVHHFGSKDGSIPARPFLGVSDEDEAAILEILDEFIQSLGAE